MESFIIYHLSIINENCPGLDSNQYEPKATSLSTEMLCWHIPRLELLATITVLLVPVYLGTAIVA
jgi:hypothetical protein